MSGPFRFALLTLHSPPVARFSLHLLAPGDRSVQYQHAAGLLGDRELLHVPFTRLSFLRKETFPCLAPRTTDLRTGPSRSWSCWSSLPSSASSSPCSCRPSRPHANRPAGHSARTT